MVLNVNPKLVKQLQHCYRVLDTVLLWRQSTDQTIVVRSAAYLFELVLVLSNMQLVWLLLGGSSLILWQI